MGSGFLAAAAAFALTSFEIFRQRSIGRHWLTLLVCLLVILAGIAITPVAGPSFDSFHARSPRYFMIALGKNLSWPIERPHYARFHVFPLLAAGLGLF